MPSRRLTRLALAVTLVACCGFKFIGAHVNVVKPLDWTLSSNWKARWKFEELGAQTAINSVGSANNALSDNNTVKRDTTTFVEGAKSALWDTSGQFLSCVGTTCTELGSAAPFTIMGFHFGASGATARDIWDRTLASNTGYRLRFETNEGYRCDIGNGTTTGNAQSAATGLQGAWNFISCMQSGNVITLTTDGIEATTALNNKSSDTKDVAVKGGLTASASSYMDDWNYVAAATTLAQRMRVCSVGPDGLLGDCDPADPTLYRQCTSNADCHGGVCDTSNAATDDPSCAAADDGVGGAGCCMGRNSSNPCGGITISACNAAGP